MTLSTTQSSVTFEGNDTTTVWPYAFRIDVAGEVEVSVYDTLTDTRTVIDAANYAITGLGDNAGGNVTYPNPGTPLTTTDRITIKRVAPFTQLLNISNQTGFDPETLEAQLDKITMQTQELNTKMGLALLAGDGDAFTQSLPPKTSLLGKTIQFNATTGEPEAGPTATDISNAGTNAAAAAASAAAAAASYDAFDDRYLGAKASDPTVDNDGDPLLTGALYWNTASNIMKVWNGAAWATIGSYSHPNHSGDVTSVADGATTIIPEFKVPILLSQLAAGH